MGVELECEVVDHFETLQLAIEGLNLESAWLSRGLQLNDRLDLELEDVQLLDGVAIAPVAKPL